MYSKMSATNFDAFWKLDLGSISSTFYLQFFCTYIVLAPFSSYILALAKNSYEKFGRKTLMKLTPRECFYLKKVQIHLLWI